MCQHAGDPAELRDTWHVPALRRHGLPVRPLQDPAGEAACPAWLAMPRPCGPAPQPYPSHLPHPPSMPRPQGPAPTSHAPPRLPYLALHAPPHPPCPAPPCPSHPALPAISLPLAPAPPCQAYPSHPPCGAMLSLACSSSTSCPVHHSQLVLPIPLLDSLSPPSPLHFGGSALV